MTDSPRAADDSAADDTAEDSAGDAAEPTEAPAGERLPLTGRLGGLSRADRKRLLSLQLLILASVAQAVVLFGWLIPVDLDAPELANLNSWPLKLHWTRLLIETLTHWLGLICIVIAIVQLLLRRPKRALAAAPLAALVLGQFLLDGVSPTPPPATGPTLKVASANLLMVNREFDNILDELAAFDPDLILLQEYSPPWHGTLSKVLPARYPYRVYTTRRDSFGAAIYSKRPFVEHKTSVPVGEHEVPTERVVVEHGGRRVVVWNIHTLPPRRRDYVVEQVLQWRDLTKHWEQETAPLLVGGDFNWSERTIFHREMAARGFLEGHETGGVGFGATWPVLGVTRWLPGIRLDHLYTRNGLVVTRQQVGVGDGSDHRPLFAELRFAAD